MHSQYFCAYHREQMKACETEALKQWSQMMHRGIKAYVECRTDAAQIYLESALDIGILRSRCERNGVFSELHVLKPAEFILNIYITHSSFELAQKAMLKISSAYHENNILSGVFFTKAYDAFAAQNLESIEAAEKAYLSGSPAPQKEKHIDNVPLLFSGAPAYH